LGWAALAMTIAILTLDQLLFRPLVAWAERFKFEHVASADRHGSWALDLYRRAHLLDLAGRPWRRLGRLLLRLPFPAAKSMAAPARIGSVSAGDIVWYLVVGLVLVNVGRQAYALIASHLGWAELWLVIRLGAITFLRVAAMTLLALAIWVPLGVAIGLRPRLARAAQPAAQANSPWLEANSASSIIPVRKRYTSAPCPAPCKAARSGSRPKTTKAAAPARAKYTSFQPNGRKMTPATLAAMIAQVII